MRKLFTLLLINFPLLLQAQTDSLSNYLHITIHIGAFVSGVPKHLEEAMRSNGFGHTDSGFFLAYTQYPVSSEPPIIQAGVERVTHKGWSDKFLLSNLRGNVYGYSYIHGYFDYKYRLTTASFLKGYHSKQRITRIAIGPVVSLVQVKTDGLRSSSKVNFYTGILAEAGVRFPKRSRVFLDFHTQYQYIIGRQDFGAYTFESTDIIGQTHRVVFQGGKKSFSYLAFNFGIGMRVEKLLNTKKKLAKI